MLASLYTLASTGRVRTVDEVMALCQAESIAREGSTAVPQAVRLGMWYGKRDREGRPQAPYAPAHALAIAPTYALGAHVLARAPGVPAEARDLVTAAGALLSSALLAALAATAALACALRLGAAPGDAVLAALALALGTPLLTYAALLFSEPMSAALLVLAALALARTPSTPAPEASAESADASAAAPLGRLLACGALLGLAVWTRPTHGIAIPVYVLAAIVREVVAGRGGPSAPRPARERVIGALGAALAIGIPATLAVTAFLARNAWLYGSPWDLGYPEAAEGGKRLNTFETPLWVGLSGFLVSPGKSALLFAPPLALALAGLRAAWGRDRALAVLAGGLPLTYVLFYARYTQWEGGYCFGPRYLVPAIAVGTLALGPALAAGTEKLRRALVVATVAGALVQGVGLATSFLEDQAVRQVPGAPAGVRESAYYDRDLTYRWGHAPLVTQGRLLLRYAASAEPAPLGKGMDRWWVFLGKAGVSGWTCLAAAAVMGAGLTLGAWGVRRALRA